MRAKEFIIENDEDDHGYLPIPLKLGDYRDPYNPRDYGPYDAKFKDNQDLRDIVENLIDAGVEPVVAMMSPRQLTATQDWLADARYRDSDPLFGDYEDRPVVLKYRGVDYILDGHHRCSAALRANQKLRVYVFTAPQGLTEAEPAHQHSDIFRTTHGKWIVYTGDHSMIRALTRGVGPRMITALLASLENIHNLDRVAIGQGFWITDVKTKSSVFFKRLDIPSEPYALRQETVVKDQPLAGKSTPVFKVNVYPGPEHPRDIKAMQHAKLVSRFVGVDTMAANLAKDMKRKRWNEPEVITDPEKQDSRRYDRAFDQAKKLPKDVAENFAGTLKEFAPNADFNRRGMGWEDFLKLVTPAMLKWGFDVDYKNTEIMYSRNGRAEDEVYFIVLDPQDDMVHYSFGSQEAGEPAIHEQNFVSMDQHGAKVFLQRADEGYLLSNLKKDVEENFADGKGPGRPGDSVRHGIPKNATMAELERASHAKGRKGQLARWQLNMRRGHKK